MKPGERIKLITECANSLHDRVMAEAQLVLRQFGAETFDPSDSYEPMDEMEYFVARVESLDDESLGNIHEYLMGDDAEPSRPAHGIWGDNPVKVFLSHCHEDASFVSEVNDILRERHGIDGFVAHRDIMPSAAWRATIRSALSTCDFLVAVLHPRFHESQWCDQEVGWALGRNIPVMPVRREPHTGARFDGFMEEHQDLVLDKKYGTGAYFLADKILESVSTDPRTQSLGLSALVESFVNSRSYDRTRSTWALIQKQPSLSPEHLRRLEYAVQTNDQVYDGVADNEPVPDLVKRLVEKFEPPAPPNPWAASPAGTPSF